MTDSLFCISLNKKKTRNDHIDKYVAYAYVHILLFQNVFGIWYIHRYGETPVEVWSCQMDFLVANCNLEWSFVTIFR